MLSALESAAVTAVISYALSRTIRYVAIRRDWPIIPRVWPGVVWAFLLTLILSLIA